MTTAYQLSAEYRLLSVLMDALTDKALLFAQIPERLFMGNRVPIYQAIKDLHKANRPIDLVTVAKQLEVNRHDNSIVTGKHARRYHHHQRLEGIRY